MQPSRLAGRPTGLITPTGAVDHADAGHLLPADCRSGRGRPESQITRRNRYRPRPWETRVGEVEQLIPRVRQGSYFPSSLEPRRRSEQAIVAVVLEAYVNGVNTDKVDGLMVQLGIVGTTKHRA
jgi:transposase-like protein